MSNQKMTAESHDKNETPIISTKGKCDDEAKNEKFESKYTVRLDQDESAIINQIVSALSENGIEIPANNLFRYIIRAIDVASFTKRLIKSKRQHEELMKRLSEEAKKIWIE